MSKFVTIRGFAIDPAHVCVVRPPFDDTQTGSVVHMLNGMVLPFDERVEQVVAKFEAATRVGDAFSTVNDAVIRRMQAGQDPEVAQSQVFEAIKAINGETS